MEDDGGGGSSGLRTRSKAAPDWTVEESLILVNEVTAIEADCRDTLSSFQKWKIIVENCNALDVNRNLNQCRRKWDSLLSDYKKTKQSESKKASFNSELFKGIERYVREYDSDTDTDPEDLSNPLIAATAIVQSGSKNQSSTPQKHTIAEKAKATRRVKSEDDKAEECSSEQRVDRYTNTLDETLGLVEINREEHEEIMAEKLRENAELIEAIVRGQMGEDLVDRYNATYDSTRINGDKIIICLSNLAATLDELCKLQTDSIG
ncbi:hypothetical protein L6452_16878 [Arctium lappa]|uniref:Uncharacterized protein n=1 Tax=Arctium lappa TaxID=4217 RepID=A0ACB9C1Z2_ARCLA|nr:hypothetical protein L6452_16878 [Arctium lappa]